MPDLYTQRMGLRQLRFGFKIQMEHHMNETRFSRLRAMIEKTLSGEIITRDAIKERDKFKKRERALKSQLL